MSHDVDTAVLDLSRVRLIHDYPGQIDACLDILSDDELWWRPNERSNAVANLVIHLAASNHYHFEHVIRGRDVSRDRAAEFASRGSWSRRVLLDKWTEARRVTEEFLDGLKPSELMETTDRSGRVMTFLEVVLHVTHHNAVHMGQIVWMTKMLHPDDVHELWMKMRSSPLPAVGSRR